MDEPGAETARGFGDVDGAVHVGSPRHRRVQFTRFESAIAGAVQDGAEAMFLEQGVKAGAVLGVEGDDAVGDELPRRRRPDADHLAGPEAEEVRQGVPARDAGDAGDEQRKARGQVVSKQRCSFLM